MKKIEEASKKYNFRELGFILASMNLVEDIKDMFNSRIDERIAAGKMPKENKEKAWKAIRSYLDYVEEQDNRVCYNTFCDLYDYLANDDLCVAVDMVAKKTLI